jgi:hypothetical protein
MSMQTSTSTCAAGGASDGAIGGNGGFAGGLIEIITSPDPERRDRSLDGWCRAASFDELRRECERLEEFRQRSASLYERVRACFFLYAIHRFHLPARAELPASGRIPFAGYMHLLERRFEEAIGAFLREQQAHGPSDTLCSALAVAYQRIAIQTLADQVRRSVRSVRGNQWMFRLGHPHDQPLRVRPELLPTPDAAAPILKESTPVRMDLTHSAWSDIFFLGMDFPAGARVLNISVDLAVRGHNTPPRPPVEAYFRVIDEPVVRLHSVDLATSVDVRDLDEIFDFARDYLGLLKAALIAAGLVPPGMEGSGESLGDLLERLVGPGHGIELVSNVNGIPKGSRLAVSTNLLASLIAVCMRATRQARSLEGPLEEGERRLVAARAILGEWLAGSGGGWQDSGGVWPGIKLIQGQAAAEGAPEWGISRGRLLPTHHILSRDEASESTRQALQDSLVLVHGGMAQNVGPILEMVTEKYLLRCEEEWRARGETHQILDDILGYLREGDVRSIGAATTRNFFEPLQAIVPWASNAYTETLIQQVRDEFGSDFWGFWMLGGMSGGGMGFIFEPGRKAQAQQRLQEIMSETRKRFENSLPFAMEPVVYDFRINETGTSAQLLVAESIALPPGYYAQTVPRLLRLDPRALSPARRGELDAFGRECRTRPELSGMVAILFDRLVPRVESTSGHRADLAALLAENGFDTLQHEQIRADLRAGRVGLAQNRLPSTSDIRDTEPGDVFDGVNGITPALRDIGAQSLRAGEVAVVTLAAGVGSRWTQGAGVVKALHPFAKMGGALHGTTHGKHRTFLEAHLAKSRRVARASGAALPHVFTTSHLTHGPIERFLAEADNYKYPSPLLLSQGRAIGLRMVPTARDLRFLWEEMPQQVLDEQAQKVRQSGHAALLEWARAQGEAADYTDNLPSQCLHPVGHWFEVPNMLRNGTLARLLRDQPALKYLLVHNIDTLGADVDAGLLGRHIESGAAMSVEVIPRRLEDRGGGLARVDGRLRLVEGLASPREETEFELSFYNTLSTWVSIDALLHVFGLTRQTLHDQVLVAAAVRTLAARIPTYITVKDVKKRWGQGQEDVFPVTQWEKLWGDMTILPEFDCRFIAVTRLRGQQLKEQAQLDGWLRDGSAAHIESICAWE